MEAAEYQRTTEYTHLDTPHGVVEFDPHDPKLIGAAALLLHWMLSTLPDPKAVGVTRVQSS